ncbi:MAG: hypothetical protein M0P12_01255 [Paludibacteraceae bacterium]|nr:hypothetical protein [Paludibacteraceae bacterium]
MNIFDWFKNLNKPEEVKICAKCNWYRLQGTRLNCGNPEYLERNIITGELREAPSCSEMRATARRCGYTGKGFSPIDKTEEKE